MIAENTDVAYITTIHTLPYQLSNCQNLNQFNPNRLLPTYKGIPTQKMDRSFEKQPKINPEDT